MGTYCMPLAILMSQYRYRIPPIRHLHHPWQWLGEFHHLKLLLSLFQYPMHFHFSFENLIPKPPSWLRISGLRGCQNHCFSIGFLQSGLALDGRLYGPNTKRAPSSPPLPASRPLRHGPPGAPDGHERLPGSLFPWLSGGLGRQGLRMATNGRTSSV